MPGVILENGRVNNKNQSNLAKGGIVRLYPSGGRHNLQLHFFGSGVRPAKSPLHCGLGTPT